MAYTYKSLFKKEIKQYLTYIENQQLSLHDHKSCLHHFDKYMIENNCSKEFTSELVEKFLSRKNPTHPNYCHNEVYVMKKFAKFLNIIKQPCTKVQGVL